MNKLTAIITSSILLFSCNIAFAQTTTQHRIIMELTSNDTTVWRATIGNIQHLKDGWGNSVQVELVAHGAGISFLLKGKTTQEGAIKILEEKGVTFSACANTLKHQNINQSQVIPEASIVPLGIGEVVLKEERGWSYIKAGF